MSNVDYEGCDDHDHDDDDVATNVECVYAYIQACVVLES